MRGRADSEEFAAQFWAGAFRVLADGEFSQPAPFVGWADLNLAWRHADGWRGDERSNWVVESATELWGIDARNFGATASNNSCEYRSL